MVNSAEIRQFPHQEQPNDALSAENLYREKTIEDTIFEALISGEIDIDKDPPDRELILEVGLSICAQLGILPWRRAYDAVIIFIDNIHRSEQVQELLAHLGERIVCLPIRRAEIVNRLPQIAGREMLRDARHYCPKALSVRDLDFKYYKFIASAIVLAIFALAVSFPGTSFKIALFSAAVFVVCNSTLRAAAVIRYALEHKSHETPIECTLHEEDLPTMTLLVPLYQEPKMLGHIFRSLSSLDYPQEKLDVKLVLEADDEITLRALQSVTIPNYAEIIRVPTCYLRTKPKAMNYTLPFAQGEILGIYDAEDRADPDQLREVAQAFHEGSNDVATVQCELTFYNSRQNWLTRCFTIEYRIWFSVFLPALQFYKMPVPLGGTSVFFKVSHLANAGGWDAHNVTEDADLGVRFMRLGYETLVLSSKTREEANPRPISWVRQRSRWLKGYILTWAAHMKNPISLYRDLGLLGFITMQVLFIGAFGNYLAIPLFWLMWAQSIELTSMDFMHLEMGQKIAFSTAMLLSQAISLSIGIIALKNKAYRYLIWTWFTLPFYWIFGSLAAYKAFVELIFNPFYWDKTIHGFGKEDAF